MNSDNDNARESGEAATIFIIIGQVSQEKGGDMAPVHVLLAAPDDDTAVRLCLDALSAKGFAEADLDQIGLMQGMPDEEPHASAYQGALEGRCLATLVEDEVVAGRRDAADLVHRPASTSRDEAADNDVFLQPLSVSTLPLTDASVSTRVVSWNEAAEMNDCASAATPW
jgi:hypothetical protein